MATDKQFRGQLALPEESIPTKVNRLYRKLGQLPTHTLIESRTDYGYDLPVTLDPKEERPIFLIERSVSHGYERIELLTILGMRGWFGAFGDNLI